MYRRPPASSTAFTVVSAQPGQINRLTSTVLDNAEGEVPKTSQKIKNRAGMARLAMFHFCNNARGMRVCRLFDWISRAP